MNSRDALRLADPARRLPPHHLDATDEAVLQQILATDPAPHPAGDETSPTRSAPRRDWRPALITGIVAVAVVAGTFAVIRTTSTSTPAPAVTSSAMNLEAAVRAKLLEAADGRRIDPDQPSLFWTQAQRGSQGDMIDLTGKTLYLAGACQSGGTVTIRISGEPDTVLDCSTPTTIGPINLTELLKRQKKSISIDVAASTGRPSYLVRQIALPNAAPETTAPTQPAARDLGPREHARGVVTEQKNGIPTQYRVAADDNAGAICNRFGRRWWQLTDQTGTPIGTYPILQPDQLIGITNAPLSDYSALQLSDNNALC